MKLEIKIFLKRFYSEMETVLAKKKTLNTCAFTKKVINNENENTIIIKQWVWFIYVEWFQSILSFPKTEGDSDGSHLGGGVDV